MAYNPNRRPIRTRHGVKPPNPYTQNGKRYKKVKAANAKPIRAKNPDGMSFVTKLKIVLLSLPLLLGIYWVLRIWVS